MKKALRSLLFGVIIAGLVIILKDSMIGMGPTTEELPAALNGWLGYTLGGLVVYLALAARWVQKPYNAVVEINIPFFDTIIIVWKPGIHFLWIPIWPIMYVRAKVNTAHKPFTLMMGAKGGAGRPDPVDFKDAQAGVKVMVILEVPENSDDVRKAVYNVQDEGITIDVEQDGGGTRKEFLEGYEHATLNKVEARLRGFFGSKGFDEANEDSEREKIERGVVEQDQGPIYRDWGVRVREIEIIDFIPPPDLATARNERLVAVTDRDAKVTRADGERQEREIIARGEAQALLELKNAYTPEVAAYRLTQGWQKSMEGSTIIATSEGGNLNVPVTMAAVMASMNQAGTPPSNPPAPANPTTPPASAGDNSGTNGAQQMRRRS